MVLLSRRLDDEPESLASNICGLTHRLLVHAQRTNSPSTTQFALHSQYQSTSGRLNIPINLSHNSKRHNGKSSSRITCPRLRDRWLVVPASQRKSAATTTPTATNSNPLPHVCVTNFTRTSQTRSISTFHPPQTHARYLT